MVEKQVTVLNQHGVHARPAALIVETAKNFQSSLILKSDNSKANAESIMSVLMLAAIQGTHLTIVAEGSDEEEAANAVAHLFDNHFGLDS